MNKRDEFIASLRRAAEFLEAHPDVPTPFPVCLGWYEQGKAGAAALAKAAGRVSKQHMDDNLWVHFEISDSLKFSYGCGRTAVCERIVVGTEVIPAQPERVVEVVEWHCDKPLLAEV
jgi:hypothetical protein